MRAPRRVATWAAGGLAAALLTAAVVVLSSGPEDVIAARPAPASPSPSSSAPVATPSPAVSPRAAPDPVPDPVPEPVPEPVEPAFRSAAEPDLDPVAVLGPPPGPQVDPRPARVAAPADRYAFLAAVTDYRPPTLDTIGSVEDVAFIRDSLLAHGWLPENIRVVTDDQTTGASIRAGMDWLVEKGRPGTFTFFHWSGHVKQKGGTQEALWPVDRDFVDDTEVAASLARVQGRLWVDIAGCEANSFVDGLPGDRVLFTASSLQTEKSYEYPPWTMSVWTGLLFDHGLVRGEADADGDGRTTVGEALRYGRYHAQAITLGQEPHGRQTPQYSGAADLGWTLADPPA